ncbi:MAG: DUF4230 domain-containing protein [Clostridia bacterium]|nr:DUF4230 domain-containing protein [Clostridia bacterium]
MVTETTDAKTSTTTNQPPKPKLMPLLCGAGVIVLAILLCVVFSGSGDITIETETALKRIVEQEKLSTAEFTYNSIAVIADEKGKELCHVAYEGTVKAGFDFSALNVTQKNKTIIVHLPEITISSVNVDNELDYIFVKERYNTEDFYAKARATCQADLEEKAKSSEALFATARTSAIDTLTALMTPLAQKLEKDGYTIEIQYVEE